MPTPTYSPSSPAATNVAGPPSEPPVQKKRSAWLWIFVLAAILAVAGGFFYWRHAAAEHEATARARANFNPGVAITTATARKGNLGVYLDAIGTVTPVYTDSITSQVNGLVMTVSFKEGQIVHAGDPLVDIDSRSYRATLLQAQGLLQRDENLLAQARLDLERYRAALARNAVAEQIVADQEKLVAQDEGTVKNDQGTVQYDQVQVDYCHITAPISGQVGLRLVDPGNVVQSSGAQTLAVITQLQPITVIFTISEDNLGPVVARLHQGVKLPVDAYDRTAQKKIARGELAALDNQIDTTTGTVKGRALFANENSALFPNQFVNTRLLVNTLQGVTLIPDSAIQHNGQTAFVFVIQNDVAHMRMVKTGVSDAGDTQVDGLNPGDAIANSGFDKLQDNAKVTVSSTPVTASTSGSNAP